MLNRDLIQMLENGGSDTRQPSRIFLPPKFYSPSAFGGGPHDGISEEDFGKNLKRWMELVYDDGLFNRKPSTSSPSRFTQPPTATTSQPSRPNSISYSDGEVGNRKKGSEVLEKKSAINFKSSLPSSLAPSDSARAPFASIAADQTASERHNPSKRTDGSTISYNLRSALPGEPDVDYPILGRIPETGFKCHQRQDGYYADEKTRCQVFRVCANTDDTGSGFAFLCPNGTLFNQKYLVCDWYTNVRCEETANYYKINERIGKTVSSFSKMMMTVMSMVSFPMMSTLLANGGFSFGKTEFSNFQAHRKNNANAEEREMLLQSVVTKDGDGERINDSPREENYNSHSMANLPAVFKEQPLPQQVYVSSLGTLSTDPQSGFDPEKSTILTPQTEENLSQHMWKDDRHFLSLNQHHFIEEIFLTPPIGSAEYEPFLTDVLTSWARSGIAKIPTPAVQVVQPILPPSGVLPSSPVSFHSRRPPNAARTSQIVEVPSSPFNPNPATVQDVYRVDKAFVTSQTYYPFNYSPPTEIDYPSLQPITSRAVQQHKKDALPYNGQEYDDVLPTYSYHLNEGHDRQLYRNGLEIASLGLTETESIQAQVAHIGYYEGPSSHDDGLFYFASFADGFK
ncbi:uncharacterized protein LOC129770923 isoform X2 [Toxorhynchites rutilus septentrionalis]|nr:uncharacterized protein LOC129770923 isoform X2 [Toxorhynchites rutilus septentrionalis]